MKRIIDGKRYDTETAEMVCDVSPSGYGNRDFRYEDTQLYRTQKGTWFLAGEGGPMTRWKRLCGGNAYGYGSGLRVIDSEHARELLEQHDALEAIEKYFTIEEA